MKRWALPEKSAETALLFEKTQDEVRKGLMHGPFTRAELDAAYGKHKWRAMRRFGSEEGWK